MPTIGQHAVWDAAAGSSGEGIATPRSGEKGASSLPSASMPSGVISVLPAQLSGTVNANPKSEFPGGNSPPIEERDAAPALATASAYWRGWVRLNVRAHT